VLIGGSIVNFRDWQRVRHAAVSLDVSPQWLRVLCRDHRGLRYMVLPDGTWLVHRADIERLAAERQTSKAKTDAVTQVKRWSPGERQ
jgi:hypothetical protein